jgi:hypothetical protein
VARSNSLRKKRVVTFKENEMAIGGLGGVGGMGGYGGNNFAGVDAANQNAKQTANRAAQTGDAKDGLDATNARNKAENETSAAKNEMDSKQKQFTTAIAPSR